MSGDGNDLQYRLARVEALVDHYSRTVASAGLPGVWPVDNAGRLAVAPVPPRVQVRHGAAQAIASAVATDLAFDIEDIDTADMHSLVSNIGRLTCAKPGLYDVVAQVEFAPNATGSRLLGIKNGAGQVLAATWVGATPGGGSTIMQAVRHAHAMAVGDYVYAYAYQDSGAALSVGASAPYTPRLTATRVGGA